MFDTLLASLSGGALGPEALLLVFFVLVAKEVGVPVPIPADLLMILVGIGAAAGGVPVVVVVLVLVVASIGGGFTHLLLVRGPAQAMLSRVGPKIGLTRERLDQAAAHFAKAGWPAVAVGRIVPGLRAVAVTACGIAGIPYRIALPGIAIGGTAFIILHVLIGYVGGPPILAALRGVDLPLLPVFGILGLLGLGGWFILRRRRTPVSRLADWADACCPVCLALSQLDPLKKA